jgi:hypothetical protein
VQLVVDACDFAGWRHGRLLSEMWRIPIERL